MHVRHETAPTTRVVPGAVLAALIAAATLAACSGSGGTANTTPPATGATPTPTPVATISPTAGPSVSPSPAPTATPSPAPTATPSPAPSATPSPTPPLLTDGCQVGSNYLDFQATGGAYVPAPGYGNFTTNTVTPTYAALGVTGGEAGQIQSLNEPPGPVTLPSAFITFASGGSNYQLNATNIPAGNFAGPFNATQVSPTETDLSFEVLGNIFNTTTSTNTGTFDLVFRFTYPGPESAIFTSLPFNTICNGFDNTAPYTASHGRVPAARGVRH